MNSSMKHNWKQMSATEISTTFSMFFKSVRLINVIPNIKATIGIKKLLLDVIDTATNSSNGIMKAETITTRTKAENL